MWLKAGHIRRIFGTIILIVALMTLSQPLQSQMVNKQSSIKSTVALFWLFNEINSTDNFFIIRESLYEPTLMLESWMLDPSGYLISSVYSESLLMEDVFIEPEMQLESWMIDLKCFCKDLPEKFCEDILEMEDWMCCPFKIR